MSESEITIEKQNIIEFEIPNQEFVIQYVVELKQWLATHPDEEKYDDDILIDEMNDSGLELFDGYILTKEMFEKCKGLVEEEMEKTNY